MTILLEPNIYSNKLIHKSCLPSACVYSYEYFNFYSLIQINLHYVYENRINKNLCIVRWASAYLPMMKFPNARFMNIHYPIKNKMNQITRQKKKMKKASKTIEKNITQ